MKPIVIYDDNRSCIFLSKNPIFHACMKHIFILHHLVQKKTKGGFLKLMYCNVENMVAYVLTKELLLTSMDISNIQWVWVKCVTLKFIEWRCWISTSYQVT
jgi:hypothetical protein